MLNMKTDNVDFNNLLFSVTESELLTDRYIQLLEEKFFVLTNTLKNQKIVSDYIPILEEFWSLSSLEKKKVLEESLFAYGVNILSSINSSNSSILDEMVRIINQKMSQTLFLTILDCKIVSGIKSWE
ncbi:hypothetical protein G4V62_18180 [Bacillaceae bacterium SIJ1]|uniref:hypothetical protein n=1 Tax=Litoribacterium kuwaitense TaxID=1398745 RepID=UPI0013EC9364|nr:hypothetical protein [Litoribacterium kuwaitense]NGP46774.1 hypothetical protein [Litoribacterium kuwaitense]